MVNPSIGISLIKNKNNWTLEGIEISKYFLMKHVRDKMYKSWYNTNEWKKNKELSDMKEKEKEQQIVRY